jgi:hypothetical protein
MGNFVLETLRLARIHGINLDPLYTARGSNMDTDICHWALRRFGVSPPLSAERRPEPANCQVADSSHKYGLSCQIGIFEVHCHYS